MSKQLLEEGQQFSRSFLWSAQREYYAKSGIEAWAGDVPFYITSNPFIAGVYARVVIRFLQDWVRLHPEAKKQPFYILELGTGSGQFSFYVIKALSHMREQLQLSEIDIHYVMTDFTENNVQFWQKHTALAPFIEQGMLDFSVFDVENDLSLTLLNSGKKIEVGSLHNPLIVFANYLFDSVLNDVFHVKEGRLYESLVSVSTPRDNLDGKIPKDWKKLHIDYEDREVIGDYYDIPEFNAVLQAYQKELNNSRFLFPIASLRAIRNLQKLSQNKLLLMSSDKGNTRTAELENTDYPDLDFHGSFSVMVNFDALARYFALSQGDCYLQSHRDAITTNIFSSGFGFQDLTEMHFSVMQHVKGFSAADYFNFYEHIEERYDECKLDMLTSLLNLSHWDPYIFDEVHSRISDLLEDGLVDELNYLKNNLHRIAENYYYLPEANDTLFNIAVIYQELDEFELAAQYYEASRQYIPEGWEVLFNLASCYYELDLEKEALDCFEAARHYKPQDKETLEFIRLLS